jgi:hypothetical protein
MSLRDRLNRMLRRFHQPGVTPTTKPERPNNDFDVITKVSNLSRHVYKKDNHFWYFEDETQQEYGPYVSEENAWGMFLFYCDWFETGRRHPDFRNSDPYATTDASPFLPTPNGVNNSTSMTPHVLKSLDPENNPTLTLEDVVIDMAMYQDENVDVWPVTPGEAHPTDEEC